MNNPQIFDSTPMRTTCGAKGIKIEQEDTQFVHAKLTLPMCKRIQKARTDAGLTQKQLAQKLFMKVSIIQSYENGKGIPVGRIIQSIEKACGIPFGSISGKPPKKKTRKKKKTPKLKLIKTKPRTNPE